MASIPPITFTIQPVEKMYAIVRFQRKGYHCWPDAPMRRIYLSHNHRHLFHVQVELEVRHDEREVEYHDLLEFSEKIFADLFPFPSHGVYPDYIASCETMARELAKEIATRYPGGRVLIVSVFEDGECGARYVTTTPLEASAACAVQVEEKEGIA
jgi:hypothetical protein